MSFVITSPLNKSFVNLLANDLWTEADIIHRTEAILHSAVSKEDELILSRKMTGFALDLVVPTEAETVQLSAYEFAAYAAQAAGVAARADMALLRSTIDVEHAQARLALPEVPLTIPGNEVDADGNSIEVANPAIAVDTAERAAAQAVVDAASTEVLVLVSLRNPVIEPEDPQEPV